MLKKIHVDDVRLGMHIHAFCGAWMDHPFWRTKFVIDSQDDLSLIRLSAVRELWIDNEKGLDVEAGTPTLEVHEAPEDIPAPAAPKARTLRPVSRTEELERAAAICRNSKRAVTDMFQDVRMGKAINADVARQVAEEIADSVERNAGALISLAMLKTADDYSYMHSVAVCALMIALGKQLGLPPDEVRAAGFAGLLHDIGKMDIPLDILNKPGKLTDEEFGVVRQHPEQGHARLLASGVTDAQTLDVCLNHHEKMDGTGYPGRLPAERLSTLARMSAVCDVYDAITSNRPYKAGWDPAVSLQKMSQWVGAHLDPQVFQAFVRSLGIYPVGSLVMLNTGRLAVVVEQSPQTLLKPVVKTVFSVKSQQRVVPETIELARPGCPHQIVGREDPAKWRLTGLSEIWAGQPGG